MDWMVVLDFALTLFHSFPHHFLPPNHQLAQILLLVLMLALVLALVLLRMYPWARQQILDLALALVLLSIVVVVALLPPLVLVSPVHANIWPTVHLVTVTLTTSRKITAGSET
jgi:hypothetical protein